MRVGVGRGEERVVDVDFGFDGGVMGAALCYPLDVSGGLS